MEIGNILEYETCKEITIDLKGNTERRGIYKEYLLIEDIKNNYIYLYNLTTQKRKKETKQETTYKIKNKWYKITKMKG